MLPPGWDGDGGPGPDVHPQITLQDINIELKNSPTAYITMNDSRVRLLAAKPTGVIYMNNFYNKYYRQVYRPTAYNGVAGANANAYNGGDVGAYNAEIYPSHTDGALTTNPEVGIYTFSGKPTTPITGTLAVACQAVTNYALYGYTYYSLDSGSTWAVLGTLADTAIHDFNISISNQNINNIQIKVQGRYGSGGSIKLGTDWEEWSSVRVYDIIVRY